MGGLRERQLFLNSWDQTLIWPQFPLRRRQGAWREFRCYDQRTPLAITVCLRSSSGGQDGQCQPRDTHSGRRCSREGIIAEACSSSRFVRSARNERKAVWREGCVQEPRKSLARCIRTLAVGSFVAAGASQIHGPGVPITTAISKGMD